MCVKYRSLACAVALLLTWSQNFQHTSNQAVKVAQCNDTCPYWRCVHREGAWKCGRLDPMLPFLSITPNFAWLLQKFLLALLLMSATASITQNEDNRAVLAWAAEHAAGLARVLLSLSLGFDLLCLPYTTAPTSRDSIQRDDMAGPYTSAQICRALQALVLGSYLLNQTALQVTHIQRELCLGMIESVLMLLNMLLSSVHHEGLQEALPSVLVLLVATRIMPPLLVAAARTASCASSSSIAIPFANADDGGVASASPISNLQQHLPGWWTVAEQQVPSWRAELVAVGDASG